MKNEIFNLTASDLQQDSPDSGVLVMVPQISPSKEQKLLLKSLEMNP